MLYMWKYSVSLEVALVFSHINWWPCFNITGKWLGSRQIRCNWAAKGASANDDKQSLDSKSVVELTNGTSGALILKMELYKFFFSWLKFSCESKAMPSCTGVCVCVGPSVLYRCLIFALHVF